ncbi:MULTISPECIES: PspC domain-containing protein [unclassified Nocardia]|uniref:PspC domain-containing protein n=1 Tax=unclassified Nocardia TaxID=2637762 RepID=UPI0033B09B93
MSRTSFGDQIQQMWHTRPVRLPRQGPIAGVAAGFGLRYGVDPVLLRVAFVVSTIFGGAGIVLYLLAWLVLSSAGNEASAAEALTDHARGTHSQTKTIVLIVALAIAVSTMGPVGLGMGGSGVVSMGLMLAGWWMLYIRHPELPTGFDTVRAESLGTAGYPAAGYPTGVPVRGYPYIPDVPPTGMYTPYTKLPDAYVPDPAATVPPRAETRTDTAESTPLLRVDATDTIVLHKDVAPATTTEPPSDATAATAPESGSAAIAPESNSATMKAEAPAPTSTDSADIVDAVVTDESAAIVVDTASTIPADDATPAPPADSDTASPDLKACADAPRATAADREADADAPRATATDLIPVDSSDPTMTIDLDKRDGSPEVATPEPIQDPALGATAVLSKDLPSPTPGFPRTGAQVPSGIDPLGIAPLAWELPEAAPRYAVQVPPPPPKRPRSRLTPITIGLAILAAALAGAAAAGGVEWMTPARIAAFALAVVGLGLIAGAFLRRGYGLLVLTAPLAGFVLLASLIGPIDFENNGAIGERVWAPTSVTELQPRYALDIGSGTLDLRGLNLTESRSVEVAVNIGDAKVHLPEGMTVNTTCDIRVADATCVEGLSGPQTPGAPVLDLHIKMHLGDVEVTRG